jgi:hypothetical protein
VGRGSVSKRLKAKVKAKPMQRPKWGWKAVLEQYFGKKTGGMAGFFGDTGVSAGECLKTVIYYRNGEIPCEKGCWVGLIARL